MEYLHLETGIEPLKDRFENNADITWDSYARFPTTDPRRILMEKNVPSRLTTRIGWRESSRARMETMQIARDEMEPQIPPWTQLHNLKLDRVELEGRKEEYSVTQLKDLTSKKIDTMEADYRVFTDGSTSGDQKNGGAGLTVSDRRNNIIHEASFPGGKW